MITPDELDALLAHIAELEAAVQEQADRIERLSIQCDGVKVVKPTTPAPPGCSYRNNGGLYLSSHEEIYRRMREGWPSAPFKPFIKPD